MWSFFPSLPLAVSPSFDSPFFPPFFVAFLRPPAGRPAVTSSVLRRSDSMRKRARVDAGAVGYAEERENEEDDEEDEEDDDATNDEEDEEEDVLNALNDLVRKSAAEST